MIPKGATNAQLLSLPHVAVFFSTSAQNIEHFFDFSVFRDFSGELQILALL